MKFLMQFQNFFLFQIILVGFLAEGDMPYEHQFLFIIISFFVRNKPLGNKTFPPLCKTH